MTNQEAGASGSAFVPYDAQYPPVHKQRLSLYDYVVSKERLDQAGYALGLGAFIHFALEVFPIHSPSYHLPDAESPLKYKFVAEMDVFVLAINEGPGGGSLKMGVVRATDQALIEIANVRAGLTEADMRVIRHMLEEGKRPVFTVRYLPKRTIGLQLVEPRTRMTWLRTDKDPAECTTEQFGPDKAVHIAHAKPVAGITLS